MIAVPPGEIVLRDDRVGQKWRVTIEPFAICRYPVTQLLYSTLVGQQQSADTNEDAPIHSVSWIDAARFCNQLSQEAGLPEMYIVAEDGLDACCRTVGAGYRLPTEAEWEYACRAGSEGPRYGKVSDIAWYRENSAGGAMPVGQKLPNDWGLHDMLGNVWEWCSDVYDPNVYGTYRIFRGGGWADDARGCLATNRRRSHPLFAIDDLGFRVARSLTSPT